MMSALPNPCDAGTEDPSAHIADFPKRFQELADSSISNHVSKQMFVNNSLCLRHISLQSALRINGLTNSTNHQFQFPGVIPGTSMSKP